MSYLSLSHCMNKKEEREVSKKELLQEGKFTPSLLNSLVEKEVFELYYKESNLLPYTAKTPLSPLSELQSRAKEEIVEQFKTHNVVLLHGVTSSGKTEIYMHFIKEVLDSQRNVLYLVPEIALTTQLMQRLQSVFGEHLWVYHSKYSDGARFRVWEKMLHSKGGELVLGVRSSIFLPLENLGLVIVDEEHETSYKQFEPAPRYHARDAAIVLASLYGAKVLLGTAT
ncbi:MAG TPA: primosomal protein N', partial [Porphyromonadaceae bacterium]|nr:primosomal protein N' [Porphyromonadaceae bacterium]